MTYQARKATSCGARLASRNHVHSPMTSLPHISVPAENRTLGIVWMLATMFCFIALDTIMKYALDHYSLIQVTWGRFFFATIAAAVICGRQIGSLMISRSPGVQLARSCLLMVTTALFNVGVTKMPLATATTIMFMSPILVTVLSVFLLKEHVGVRRWASIFVGFCGAVIVAQPWEAQASSVTIGALFLLAAALTNALYQIVTRQLRFDDPLTSLLFTAAAGAVVTTLLLPGNWTQPDAFGWLLLVTSGIAGAVGHWCLIQSLRSAPASVVAPFSYSSLIWSILFGFIVFQDQLPMATILGAVLIVGSGLYIFFRERKLKGGG
jgi:drug/metabolite transporter (DMT)-like permease